MEKQHIVYTLADIIGEPSTEQELDELLRSNGIIYQRFTSLNQAYQDRLMNFLLGRRGLAITYDDVFKYLINPEKHPERLEFFLSSAATHG